LTPQFCASRASYFDHMIEALNFVTPAIAHHATRDEIKAGREFESVLLTHFVEQMLPEINSQTDSPQAGGDVWRSFLAQAIADQLASQNATGISSLIAQQLMQVRENG
jgi:peptidoglycan hydrolase FlgJ